MAQFKTGDIFALPLSDNEWICGHILLDINRQCVKTKLIQPPSNLLSFPKALLVEIYSHTSPKPEINQDKILIPGIFIDSNALARNSWPIISNKKIDPALIDFPESLINIGPKTHFIKGEISIPLDLPFSEVRNMNVYKTQYPSGILAQICLYHLKRKHEIKGSDPKFSGTEKFYELRNLARSDFRFNQNRDQIYQIIKQNKHQSYYEMALQKGYDLKRFYSAN